MLPEQNTEYGEKEYWENRYLHEEYFEWFKSYSSIESKIKELIPIDAKILHLGCGNSLLAVDMTNDGYTKIVNLDYSENVIQKMKNLYPQLCWVVGDIFNLSSYKDYDAALDKGTLDALLTAKHDPWNPNSEITQKISNYINNVADSLKPNGKFLQITFAQPHFRKRFFEIRFDVKVHSIQADGGLEYFCYECILK